ncbi:beta strand repeat-containing protein [Aquidulcibacter sp.]|jgi:filamentous hemagglutinin family protein|uniref:beta strand repeat-containing protein n=1 Tax=Aquidulcibacter sp. TaxID=2052990 RepID=UPI0037BECC4B
MSLLPVLEISKDSQQTSRSLLLSSLSLFALSVLMPKTALALPAGEVIAGSTPVIIQGPAATFTRSGPNADLLVRQNAERVVIDWTNFDIASGESVTFQMGAPNWIALNRVAGAQTNINGILRSEIGAGGPIGGHVWIYNPNGMIFGTNARVDVGGLLATSAAPAMADFLGTSLQTSGLEFGRGAQTAPSTATIAINAGAVIQSPGGIISFLSPVISQAGTVTATNPTGDVGQVLFGLGDNFRVGFAADPTSPGGWDLVSYEGFYLGATSSGGFTHTGITRGGQVLAMTPTNAAATIVNIDGLMEATSATISPTGVVILSEGEARNIDNLVSANLYGIGGSGQTNINVANNSIVSAGNIIVTGSSLNIGAMRTTAGSISLFAAGGGLNINGALNASSFIRFETGGTTTDIRINADLTAGERISMYSNRDLYIGNGVTPITLRSNSGGSNAATDTLYEARGNITQAANALLVSGAVGTPSGLIRLESIGNGRGTGVNVGNVSLLGTIQADSVSSIGNDIVTSNTTNINAAQVNISADRSLTINGIVAGGDMTFRSSGLSDGNLVVNGSVVATSRSNSIGTRFAGNVSLQSGISTRLGAASDLIIDGTIRAEGSLNLFSLRDIVLGAGTVINGDTDGNSLNTLFSSPIDDVEITSFRNILASPTSLIRSGATGLSGSIEIRAGAVTNAGSGGSGTLGRIEGRSVFVRAKRTDNLASGGNLVFNGAITASDRVLVWDDELVAPLGTSTTLTFNAPTSAGQSVVIESNYGQLIVNAPVTSSNIRLRTREALNVNQAITGDSITIASTFSADTTINANITSTGDAVFIGRDLLVTAAANLDAPSMNLTASRSLTFNGTARGGEIAMSSGFQADGNLVLNGQITANRRQNLAGTQFTGYISVVSGSPTRTGASSDLIINGVLRSEGRVYLSSWRDIRLGAAAFINGDSDGNSTNGLLSPVDDVAIISVRDIISAPTSVIRSGAGTLTGSIAIYAGATTAAGYGGSGTFGRIEGGNIFVGSRLTQDLTRGGSLEFNGAVTAINNLLVIDDNSGAAQTGTPTIVSFNAPITVGRSVSIEANYGQLRLNVPIIGPSIRLSSRDSFVLNQALSGPNVSITSGDTITLAAAVTAIGSNTGSNYVQLIAGNDLDIGARVIADAVYINAGRPGSTRDIVLGGIGASNERNAGAATLTQAELDLITAPNLVIASRSSGQGAAIATGSITVRDLALDGARITNLTLNTGQTSTVLVSGRVTQSSGSTVLNIGSPLTSSTPQPPINPQLAGVVGISDPITATTPGRVFVTGAMGTRANPIGTINIRAYTDIIFGTQAFVDLLTSVPNTPSQAVPAAFGGALPGQVWVSSNTLTLGSSRQIVMQNTGTRLLGEGLVTQAPTNAQALALILAGPSGAPTRVDLFGSLLGNGTITNGYDVARVTGLLSGDLVPSVSYRFNGCVIPSGVGCLPISQLPSTQETLSSTVSGALFANSVAPPISSLQREEDEELGSGGPVTGSGREEEWIKLPIEPAVGTQTGGAL